MNSTHVVSFFPFFIFPQLWLLANVRGGWWHVWPRALPFSSFLSSFIVIWKSTFRLFFQYSGGIVQNTSFFFFAVGWKHEVFIQTTCAVWASQRITKIGHTIFFFSYQNCYIKEFLDELMFSICGFCFLFVFFGGVILLFGCCRV